MPEPMEICPRRGCGKLRPRGGDCADGHRAQAAERRRAWNSNDEQRRERQKTDGRDLRQWRRIRAAVIARDGGQCLRCHTETGLTVHRVDGGFHDHDLDRYQTLCRTCHGVVGSRKFQHAPGGFAA